MFFLLFNYSNICCICKRVFKKGNRILNIYAFLGSQFAYSNKKTKGAIRMGRTTLNWLMKLQLVNYMMRFNNLFQFVWKTISWKITHKKKYIKLKFYVIVYIITINISVFQKLNVYFIISFVVYFSQPFLNLTPAILKHKTPKTLFVKFHPKKYLVFPKKEIAPINLGDELYSSIHCYVFFNIQVIP